MELEPQKLCHLIETSLRTSAPVPFEGDQGTVREWDSFGHMAILAAVEEEYGLNVSMEHVPELTSVKAIFEYIKKNRG